MADFSAIDLQILDTVQQDASLTTQEISERINISQSPCWRRINRLEEQGVIKRKVAILDREKLGLDVVVFATISLTTQGRSNLDDFEREVRTLSEVMECYTMTGTWDYMLKVVVKNIRCYELFVRQKLTNLAHVREIHSHIAVTEIKYTTVLPLHYDV
jgi:Lrp/AsnC family transcriptional regulator